MPAARIDHDGELVSVGVNGDYLADALAAGEGVLQIAKELDPIRYTTDGEGRVAVIMPLRI